MSVEVVITKVISEKSLGQEQPSNLYNESSITFVHPSIELRTFKSS